MDDLGIASENPKNIIDTLMIKYEFKLKGTGPIAYHLGCDFTRDDNGVMCIAPRKYIEKMESTFLQLFGHKPNTKRVMSPLEKGDHPEMDISKLLNAEDTVIYQSLIGALQWAVSLARFDIATAVMTLSSFRAAPRQGHLERLKRLYGYLSKMKHAAIRILTDEPDYSDIPDQDFDWSYTVHGDVAEIVPEDTPVPLGKFVTITHFVDANLFHCKLTGRSVTGILDLVNKNPEILVQ